MSNKFLLKKSSVASKVPLTTDLDYGELALNYADGKIYFKNASNVIKSFTIDDSVVTLTGTQTLTNKTLTSPTISGGTINNTVIGGTTAAAGSFTTVTATGIVSGLELTSSQSSGDEGGQINLALPQTNNTLSGGVIIDVYQNKLRIFEQGGSARGVFIDLTSAAAGVSSNLLSGGSVSVLGIAGDTGTDNVTLGVNTLTFVGGTGLTSTVTDNTVTFDIDSTVTTLTGTQTLTNKTLTSPTINGGTITVQDASFILQDNADATKQAKFELSGLPTATTVTYTLPTGSGGASTLIDASTTQNITGQKVFNAATVTFGNATTTGTYGLGNGATTSGNTRTIQIGNAGLAGSTTAITIGGTANTTTVAANGTWTFNTPLANTNLANSSVTVGTTAISLGGSSTSLAGLTSVTSTSFVGALTGNADTVTNGVYTTGSYANPAWITSLAGSKISGNISNAGTIYSRGSFGMYSSSIAGNPLLYDVQDQGGNVVIEIGRTDGTSGTSVLDFHSGATAVDYDARMQAIGGNGTVGGGTFNFLSANFRHNSVDVVTISGTQTLTNKTLTSPTIGGSLTTFSDTTDATSSTVAPVEFAGGVGIAKKLFVGTDATVNGNLQIDGNLTVSGTTVTINATNLAVEDNMIYLNQGSAVANPDLGIAGNYNDGVYKHGGFFRDATDGYWKVFKDYTPEPDASAFIDTAHASFALADIQAANFRGALVGNAATATKLATARTINGTSFDGSANITVTATATNTLTIGTGLSGTSYNGSSAVTVALASAYGDTTNPYASKTANYVLAAPNGASGVPTFRSIVAADVPTLNQNTTGSSGSCTGNAATATNATNASNLTGGNITGNMIVANATSPNSYYLQFGDNTGWVYRFMTNVSGTPTVRFSFQDNGAFTAVNNVTAYSDERLKKNWRPVQEGFVENLAKVKSGIYDRTDIEATQAGVSAQDMQKLLAETVQTGEDGTLSLAYGNAALVAAIELAKQVVELKKEIEELKKKVG